MGVDKYLFQFIAQISSDYWTDNNWLIFFHYELYIQSFFWKSK